MQNQEARAAARKAKREEEARKKAEEEERKRREEEEVWTFRHVRRHVYQFQSSCLWITE